MEARLTDLTAARIGELPTIPTPAPTLAERLPRPPTASRSVGEAYNPYTGAYGATRQGSNAYGSWGQSVVSKNGNTAYTQHASNAYGSAGTVQTSAGGKGAATSTAYGNTAAGKTSNGDMYAGHDGNVYKNTGSGWQKYDNGSWNDVQKPTTTSAQNYSQQHPTSLPTRTTLRPSRRRRAIPITLPISRKLKAIPITLPISKRPRGATSFRIQRI